MLVTCIFISSISALFSLSLKGLVAAARVRDACFALLHLQQVPCPRRKDASRATDADTGHRLFENGGR